MKKILITPLLTMLIVSCGTISNSTSNSSTTTFSSTNSSSTGSSSEEPINTRKVPFNQIGSLVAQVVDAKAMGIVNSKDRTQLNGRRNTQGEDQNYMVKFTETYNPNTQITEDETVQVTFTRVTETTTTELQTGTEFYLATAEPLTIERLTDLPGNIVITNVEGFEYRLLSGDVVIQHWVSSDQPTLEFIFDEELTGISIESRSLNASISFIAFEGFTYTIKKGESVIYEAIQDNDETDTNEAVGNITLFGLTEGLTYDVTYSGYQVIETITQDEVEGQVDKLYVLYQYTFISFVPLNLNNRPQGRDLELDYDDVALYDKQGYFSDSTRQSFVVNNDTGLIYKIENINIEIISKGIIWLKDNFIPHDFKINLNEDLEFFPLYTNSTIITFDAFKDKHGNKFIFNNRLNLTDVSSKTTFFVYNYNHKGRSRPGSRLNKVLNAGFTDIQLNVSGFAQNSTFWLTDENTTVYIRNSDSGSEYSYPDFIKDLKFIDNHHNKIDEPPSSEFKIFDFEIYLVLQVVGAKPYKFKDGKMFMETMTNSVAIVENFTKKSFTESNGVISAYDLNEKKHIYIRFFGNYNGFFIQNHDSLIEYSKGRIFHINNISLFFSAIFDFAFNYSLGLYNDSNYFHYDFGQITSLVDEFNNTENWFWSLFKNETGFILDYNLIIDGVSLENFEIIKFGIDGNTTYELILEILDGKPTFTPYVKDTYVAPAPTSITLQPINR